MAEQVAKLTEQRETLTAGLQMVQDELDKEHERADQAEAEAAQLRTQQTMAPAGLPSPPNVKLLAAERDELRHEMEALQEEHASLHEAYENAMNEHGSMESKVDDLEQALKMTREALATIMTQNNGSCN